MAIREQLKSFKKERILEQAQRLFYERGFRGTSLEAIADAMGMTKPFVYGAYGKKIDILYDIAMRNVTMSLDAVTAGRASDGTPTQQLVEVARRLTGVCIEHREAVTVFFREETALDPEHMRCLNDMRGQIDQSLAELLEEGVRTKEFHIRDVRTAALAIGGMVSWVYSWYRPTGRLDAETIKEQMARYALRIAGAHPINSSGEHQP